MRVRGFGAARIYDAVRRVLGRPARLAPSHPPAPSGGNGHLAVAAPTLRRPQRRPVPWAVCRSQTTVGSDADGASVIGRQDLMRKRHLGMIRREDSPPLLADLDCAVRGSRPLLRVCLEPSRHHQPTQLPEYAPRTNVPAYGTFGPADKRCSRPHPPLHANVMLCGQPQRLHAARPRDGEGGGAAGSPSAGARQRV